MACEIVRYRFRKRTRARAHARKGRAIKDGGAVGLPIAAIFLSYGRSGGEIEVAAMSPVTWESSCCEVCCEIMLATGQLRTGGFCGPVRMFKTHRISHRLSTGFYRKTHRVFVKVSLAGPWGLLTGGCPTCKT